VSVVNISLKVKISKGLNREFDKIITFLYELKPFYNLKTEFWFRNIKNKSKTIIFFPKLVIKFKLPSSVKK
jgi:hypothetical protein